MKLRWAPLSAILTVSLASAPIAASAAPAADRSAAPIDGEQLAGDLVPAWLIAAVLVVGLGILVFSDDDEEEPVSP